MWQVHASPASTVTVRTRVECETKRVSQAACAAWKMSKPKRTPQGWIFCSVCRPPPSPRPCSSVNPNVGRQGGFPVTEGSTSKSQPGKLESVPPSTIREVPPAELSSRIGSKKYGIDMLIRAAREILKWSGSISVDEPGSL